MLLDLPDDILYYIWSYVDKPNVLKDIESVYYICKEWRRVLCTTTSELYIEHTSIDQIMWSFLSQFINLKIIIFQDCTLITRTFHLPYNLHSLTWNSTKQTLHTKCLRNITRSCPFLNHLRIRTYDVLDMNSFFINDDGLRELTYDQHELQLQTLDIPFRNLTHISSCLLSRIPHLQSLDLQYSPQLQSDTIQCILPSLRHLKTLVLDNMLCISDTVCKSISIYTRELTHLSLNYTNITDCGLRVILLELHNLQDLELASCKFISDSVFLENKASFLNLKKLDISECVKITKTIFTQLVYCPVLRELNIIGCYTITHNDILRYLKNTQSLLYLHLPEAIYNDVRSTETSQILKMLTSIHSYGNH